MNRQKRNAKFKGLCLVLLTMLVNGCDDSFEVSAIQVDQLCSAAEAAFAKNDYSDLLLKLGDEFNVARSDIRITKAGIFIPTKTWFVNEEGYFLAKLGVDISGQGTDPSFHPFRGCFYRYRIKG